MLSPQYLMVPQTQMDKLRNANGSSDSEARTFALPAWLFNRGTLLRGSLHIPVKKIGILPDAMPKEFKDDKSGFFMDS